VSKNGADTPSVRLEFTLSYSKSEIFRILFWTRVGLEYLFEIARLKLFSDPQRLLIGGASGTAEKKNDRDQCRKSLFHRIPPIAVFVWKVSKALELTKSVKQLQRQTE